MSEANDEAIPLNIRGIALLPSVARNDAAKYTYMLKLKYIIIILIIIAIAIGAYFYFNQDDKKTYEFVKAERGDIAQIVSVTGQVKPAEDIDLSFDRSGKISKVNVKVGDKVSQDQVLITLDNAELNAQLAQARAALESQKAKLDEMARGTRAEEMQIAQITVDNAQKSLTDAQTNLENVKSKANADLKSTYDSALTSAVKSVTVALNSLFVLTDIQGAHFLSYDQDSIKLADAKADAVFLLLGEIDSGRTSKDALNQLNGGAKAVVQTAQTNPTYENIDKALSDVATALAEVKTALNTVPVTAVLTSTEVTNLSTEKSSINTEVITISGKQQSIAVQKSTNTSSIATAESSVNTAKNTLASAEANLALKKAGSAPEQIAAQAASVKQAQANVLQIQTNIDKTILKAPASGTITAVEKKRGETAQMNATIISMINSGQYQIEANISETDIAKIKLQDTCEMTLDALGSKEEFTGKIVKIDPAETVVSGVVYYKITSIFDSEDGRIKSGMTVNMDIITETRSNILMLPYYVIKQRNGDKYVLVMESGKAVEKIIKTGLEGETMVEIISGLKEGEEAAVEK